MTSDPVRRGGRHAGRARTVVSRLRAVPALYLAMAVVQGLPHGAAAADLPVPCGGGVCGADTVARNFVQSGTATITATTTNSMTVTAGDKAILNWQSFDVGAGHSVQFVQPSATAAVLNRIWSADPSVVAGALQSNGQIYLVNQNGIVFADGARVDTAGLVASSLNVTDELFRNGILSGNAAFTGVGLPAVFDAGTGAAGPVSVERGAVLTTSTGGRVMLFASTVRNEGAISTPDGQTILGAGRTVYLAASTDPSMRGLLIQVNGNGDAAKSTVTNAATGIITADRGNVTLAGLMVNQTGRVRATTSVSANGTVYLVAGDTSRPNPDSGTGAPLQFYDQARPGFGQLLPNRGGTLTLASGSSTTILPDATDRATVNDGQSFLRSAVNLVGETVVLRGTAEIRAPAGSVTISAASNPIARQLNPSLGLGAPANASRIFLDAGSVIDVGGLRDVEVPATRNLIKVELRANELQDTPLLRTSVLRSQSVVVDIRQGTTLAEIGPYRNNIQRGIAEKSIVGGSISLLSEGDVVARAGSRLDVSGGSIAYTAGLGTTTQLLGADGKTYDIATAPKDVAYTGFADAGSIGTGRTLAAYQAGASAGTITVVAPQVALRSALAGHTVVGLYQRTAPLLPSGGRFVLGDAAAGDTPDPVKDFRTGAIRLQASSDDLPRDFDPFTSTLPATNRATALVSARALADGGFDRVALYGNGAITVPANATLALGSHGALVLSGGVIALDGKIDVRGGSVDLRARGDTFGGQATDGGISLGAGARITTSGLWVNDSPRVILATGVEPDLTARGAIDGGAVTLRAFRSVALAAGSSIDASGGGWIERGGNLLRGVGGDITIAANAGADPTQISGGILLDGTLRSIAFSHGGHLTLDSASVTIGGSATSTAGELHLDAGFFDRGGFSGYQVIGQNSLVVAPGTRLQPQMQNLLVDGPAIDRPTGTDIGGFTADRVLTLAQGRLPVDLHFATRSTGLFIPGAGDLLVGAGASIGVDPGGAIVLEARENLTVLGDLSAPGGRIALRTAPGVIVGSDDINQGYLAGQRLLVGGSARLSAGAVSKITTETNALGLRKGQVLDGGIIEISATKGTVILEAGSSADVSGVTDVVDLEVAGIGGGVRATTVAGAAGSIEIRAREGWTLAGSLTGRRAALAGAAGGRLTLGFDLYDRTQDPNAQIFAGGLVPRFDTSDRVLTLTAGGTGTGTPAVGTARASVAAISAGGFDVVTLRSTDVIRLDGALGLAARSRISLEAPLVEATAGTRAQFNAPIVTLGNPDGRNQPGVGTGRFPQPLRDPAIGDAELNVAAALIDLTGNATLGGFRTVTLASTGDIRLHHAAQANGATDFTGSLKTTADLTLQAAQIYPTTRTAFTINPVSGGYAPGTVTIAAGGSGDVPLSAGGALTVRGSDIVQGGTLRAPFGTLSLVATRTLDVRPGSITSVSADGRVIPYGRTQNGTDWIYRIDTTGANAVVSTPPEKRITLDAPSVNLAAGARIDLSGGGDLYAYEFIAGPGGSKDVLDAASGRFTAAIVPGLGSDFAPLDHQYGLGIAIAPGTGVYLKGVPGVPDGFHPLLPARYALLPGALAVSAAADRTDLAFGTTFRNLDGSLTTAVLAGQAGTDIVGSRTQALVLTDGAGVRMQSQFVESTADAFFSGVAAGPRVPRDAGRLVLGASTSLSIDATIALASVTSSTGGDDPPLRRGRGGEVSLVAPRIAVVDAAGAGDGFLQVAASKLNGLGAERLVLGANTIETAGGTVLNVGSAIVEFRHGASAPLAGAEVLTAATDRITMAPGAGIVASGTVADAASPLRVTGGGALLRVSAGGPATLVRTDVPAGAGGQLEIGSHAHLEGRSVQLDATDETVVAGTASIAARAVSVASSRVSLGDVPADTPGLRITSALLSTFDGLEDLSIRSYGSLDLFGATTLGVRGADGTPALGRLAIDAAAIVGHGTAAKVITAREILLSNLSDAACPAPACTGDGTGVLRLEAGSATAAGGIGLGAGTKRISGFSATTFDATGEIRAAGNGSLALSAAGDLELRSARVTGATGTDQGIVNATGAVRIVRHDAAIDEGNAGIGARLAITAASIEQDGRIELPSGVVELRAATGDIVLGGESVTRAGGVTTTLGGQRVHSAGGRIALAADAGDVVLAEGGILDVSGARQVAGGGDAGTLTIRVPAGTFTADGTLRGSAVGTARPGDFVLDARSIGDLDGLGASLAASGFAGALDLRAHTGDIVLTAAATLRGSSLRLTADGGAITVAGAIDTRGPQGGAISLWSRGNLSLAADAVLESSGTAGRGGAVTLGTSEGAITVAAGSTIDLRGTGGPDGTLLLRAPRTAGNNEVRVEALDGSVLTSNTVIVEGVRAYDVNGPSGSATLGGAGTPASGNLAFATATNPLRTETRTFANAGATIAARLATPGRVVQVRPGIEVRSNGALTLTNVLDFRSGTVASPNWRVDGVPVNLTLRAGEDLTIAAPLTDGFQSVTGRPVTQWTLASGDSASYRLAAGADLASADPLAVVADGGGHFTLRPGQLIRTGNGTIDIAASRHVRIGYDAATDSYTQAGAQAAVVYTAGVPGDPLADFATPVIAARFNTASSYPTRGGDISVRAGDDVRGAPTTQLTSDWLWRRGAVRPDGTIGTTGVGTAIRPQNTTWWIAFDRFQQGIGALGGGDVRVDAGRDVVNVSAVIPTNGRLAGAAGSLPDPNRLVIQGGGDLDIVAGRDIRSGLFLVDRGTGRLAAGGDIASGRVVPDTNPAAADDRAVYPILVMGDAAITVQARRSVTLDGAINTPTIPMARDNKSALASSYFYTFQDDSRLTVASVAGDVRLRNDVSVIRATTLTDQLEATDNEANFAVYPPDLSVTAAAGSIELGVLRLFPSATGELGVLAARDVRLLGAMQMHESDVTRVASPLRPVTTLAGIGAAALPGRSPEIYLDTVRLPAAPLHAGDVQPVRIAARDGSIVGNSQPVELPKSAVLTAGQDIDNLRLSAKNFGEDAETRFEAGRDIAFDVSKTAATNQLATNNDGIRVGGIGSITVLAGRDIDLGNSRGIVSRGNLDDVRLPGRGATIDAFAGLGRNADGTLRLPAADAFAAAYLDPLFSSGTPSGYGTIGSSAPFYATAREDLSRFMLRRAGIGSLDDTRGLAAFLALDVAEVERLQIPGNRSELEGRVFAAAYAAFEAMPRQRQVSWGFFEQLRLSNQEAAFERINVPAEQRDAGRLRQFRGLAAIDTLFPGINAAGDAGTSYGGDINLFFSQIKTEQGGDLNLFTPGGRVVVGLPNPPAELTELKRDTTVNPPLPAAANLGLLALAEGGIRVYSKGDISVNQARILTLQGGDILLWSSEGNIDAGRGAKTASAAPPPVIQTDANGNVFVNPSGAVSGSGIGQLLTRSGIRPGVVDLIALRGELNANDAGVLVAGDLTIDARIVGAGNIAAAGTTTGVAAAGPSAAAIAGGTGVADNTAGATKDVARTAPGETPIPKDTFKPSFLTVRLFCLGAECGVGLPR